MTIAEHATEAEFQTFVVDLARFCGWTVAHFRPARVQRKDGTVYHETPVAADGKGFPDLVLVHPSGSVLFRELKSAKGRLTSEQKHWLETLQAAGADAGVWRPGDADVVTETLMEGRR